MDGKTEKFIAKAKLIHGEKYDYSKTNYVNSTTKVCITCKKHGEFWQRPCDHLQGKGCSECGREKCKSINEKYNTESFIEKCKEIYGDSYDFSKTSYNGSHEYVQCECKKHGIFKQKAYLMLQFHGCQECGKELKSSKRRKTNEEFLKEAREIHGDKYDYLEEYIGSRNKIKIQCKTCGRVFEMTPFNHIIGKHGCEYCNRENSNLKKRFTKEEFIERAKKIHGEKYDYTFSVYKGYKKPLEIFCKSCNKAFKQTPNKHISCGHGCPFCNSSKMENEIGKVLSDNGIVYETQKRFKWLGQQSLDFFIPSKNIAIECQGIQHFKSINFFGGDDHLEYVKTLDDKKKQLCNANGIDLIYFTNLKLEEYPYVVFENVKTILKKVID